jgi:ADP-heptose:LPS heptosyltransferase
MINKIKFDCKYFKGYIPCKPNKEHNVDCSNCSYYIPVDKKILIIKLGAMGDVIRTTPLLHRFREMYPNSSISWITLFPDVLPPKMIDNIYKWNESSIYIAQNKEWDIAINLDKEEETCMLLANINAKTKYGFTWDNGHIAPATPAAEHKLITGFFDHISKENKKHYLEEIFEVCNLQFQDEPYFLNYDKDLGETWKKRFESLAQGKKIIGLNTGCGERWQTRLWPTELWTELINDLQREAYFPIVLGGPQEDKINRYFSEQTGCHYPGTFSLKEFFAITSACDLVVTQVSMMMHIAIALKKKMILMNNIFNSNEFYLYGRGVIVEPESGCDCYYGNKCKRERSCMYDISPQTILDKTNLLLKLS